MYCSCAYAKVNIGTPYLNVAKKQSSSQPTIAKLSPYPSENNNGSASGSGDSSFLFPSSDLQDAIEKLRDLYLNSLDTLRFNSCCQPKFLGLGGISPSIFPMRGGSSSMNYAYCDMHTEGGGWMVILRREKKKTRDSSIYFQSDYHYYKNGFGRLNREYWLGLIHMHHFTGQPGGTELMVELILNDTKYVAYYDNFFVDSEKTNFTLKVGGYRKDKSNISDSLSSSSGFGFTTVERDYFRSEVLQQTRRYTGYCTILYEAWWFGSSGNETCTLVAPVKAYFYRLYQDFLLVPKGYMWVVDGKKIGFDSIEMKMRPKTWECGANMYTDQVIRLALLSHRAPQFNPFLDEDQD